MELNEIIYKGFHIIPWNAKYYKIKIDNLYIASSDNLLESFRIIDYLADSEILVREKEIEEDDF